MCQLKNDGFSQKSIGKTHFSAKKNKVQNLIFTTAPIFYPKFPNPKFSTQGFPTLFRNLLKPKSQPEFL